MGSFIDSRMVVIGARDRFSRADAVLTAGYANANECNRSQYGSVPPSPQSWGSKTIEVPQNWGLRAARACGGSVCVKTRQRAILTRESINRWRTSTSLSTSSLRFALTVLQQIGFRLCVVGLAQRSRSHHHHRQSTNRSTDLKFDKCARI